MFNSISQLEYAVDKARNTGHEPKFLVVDDLTRFKSSLLALATVEIKRPPVGPFLAYSGLEIRQNECLPFGNFAVTDSNGNVLSLGNYASS